MIFIDPLSFRWHHSPLLIKIVSEMRYQDKLVDITLKVQSAKLALERNRIDYSEYLLKRRKLKDELKALIKTANNAGFPTPIGPDSPSLSNFEL